MDDSWSRFWDRLISDWVGVAVAGFVLQGVWFGAVSFLTGVSPTLEPTLASVSAKLGWPWLFGMAGGFSWGLYRAWKSRRVREGRKAKGKP